MRIRSLGLWLLSVFLLLAFFLPSPKSFGQPIFLDLTRYRTPVSPGKIDEDALFLKEIVEQIARDLAIAPVAPRGERGFESFDVDIKRDKILEETGAWKLDKTGKAVFAATPTIEIKGESYKQITRSFLEWRRSFELEWIQGTRSATEELKPTPLQRIFYQTSLPQSERVRQTVQFYRFKTIPRIPKPTPNPSFWPVSAILDLPECGVQVQFNLRGGRVTILDSESSRVWVLPFPPEADPHRWMAEYRREVEKSGKEQAAERLRQEAIAWGLPVRPAIPVSTGESADGKPEDDSPGAKE